MALNTISLVGRLVRDPESRTTNTGKTVCNFTIAVQKRMKPKDGEPDADFFRIQTWNQTAEFVMNYLAKGRLVSLTGRMESRKYVDSDGNNREIWEVTAQEVNGLDRPKDDNGQERQPTQHSNRNQAASHSADEYDPFADE